MKAWDPIRDVVAWFVTPAGTRLARSSRTGWNLASCEAKTLRAALLLVLVLSGVAAAGCSVFQSEGGGSGGGGGAQAVGPEGNEAFDYDLGTDIPDLNPTTTTDIVSISVLNNVMEGLYRLDEDENPQPAMAEEVTVSEDGRVYTFTLRDGIEWSNGEPVTSEDFRYAWLRAMDPDTAGQYSFILSDYVEGGAEFAAGEAGADDVGIEAPDERTLRITLARPTPYFLGLTSFPTYFPLNKGFVEGQGAGFAKSPETLLYNGPYTMTRFDPARGVTLEKNGGYWDAENVDIERVNARIVKDVGTRVNLYESGELDYAELGSEYVDRFRDSPEFSTITNFVTSYLEMNRRNPVMRNANIRGAIQRGFDRRALAGTVLDDGSVAAEGYVPPGVAGPGGRPFREAAGPTAPGFDPGRARELYERGAKELGEEPTIEILTDDDPRSKVAATFLQAQLQDNLGAEVELKQQPYDSKVELAQSGDYQVALSSWIADYNDPMTFLNLWTTDSPFNTIGFSNARYDGLIESAEAEANPKRRMDALVEAERLLIGQEAALAPAFHQGEAKLVKPYVKNYTEHPYGQGVEFKYARIEKQ